MGGIFSAIGSLFGDKPSVAPPPPPPVAPPPSPQLPQAQGQAGVQNAQRRALIAQGPGATQATGPQGLVTPESGAPKSLLGG